MASIFAGERNMVAFNGVPTVSRGGFRAVLRTAMVLAGVVLAIGSAPVHAASVGHAASSGHLASSGQPTGMVYTPGDGQLLHRAGLNLVEQRHRNAPHFRHARPVPPRHVTRPRHYDRRHEYRRPSRGGIPFYQPREGGGNR
jgi:hypothetical protein